MIDTIQLRLLDYKIKKDNNLTIYPSPYKTTNGYIINNTETVLYNSNDNEFVLIGYKAVYNNNLINFDIKEFNDTVLASVHFSAPKIKSIGDNNLETINKNDLIDIAITVEKELKSAGIEVNIKKATKISRIDLFKNIYTKNNIMDYKQVFDLLTLKRSNEIVERSYYTTFYKGNKSRMLVIYDKVKEMQIKNKNISNINNIIRFELRHFKNRNINKYINCDTYNCLIDRFDNIAYYYNNYLRGLFDSINIDNTNIINNIDYFVKNKYDFDSFIKYLGMLYLSNLLDIDKIKYLVEYKFGYTRQAVDKIINKIKQVKLSYCDINKKDMLLDKINELRGLLAS